MEEKPADEFLGRKRHRFLLTFVSVVFPVEAHLTRFDTQQAIIRDRDAVGVAADVVQHLLWASKGRLGIDDPFCLSRRCQVTSKLAAIPKIFQGVEELQLAGIERVLEMLQE